MRLVLPPLVLFSLAVVIASYLRYQLVEPAQMSFTCEASNAMLCRVRALAITLLTHERVGWAALALSAVSFFGPARLRRLLAQVALACAGLGLVLYNAELAAPASVLAALSLSVLSRKVATASEIQHANKPQA